MKAETCFIDVSKLQNLSNFEQVGFFTHSFVVAYVALIFLFLDNRSCFVFCTTKMHKQDKNCALCYTLSTKLL